MGPRRQRGPADEAQRRLDADEQLDAGWAAPDRERDPKAAAVADAGRLKGWQNGQRASVGVKGGALVNHLPVKTMDDCGLAGAVSGVRQAWSVRRRKVSGGRGWCDGGRAGVMVSGSEGLGSPAPYATGRMSPARVARRAMRSRWGQAKWERMWRAALS